MTCFDVNSANESVLHCLRDQNVFVIILDANPESLPQLNFTLVKLALERFALETKRKIRGAKMVYLKRDAIFESQTVSKWYAFAKP